MKYYDSGDKKLQDRGPGSVRGTLRQSRKDHVRGRQPAEVPANGEMRASAGGGCGPPAPTSRKDLRQEGIAYSGLAELKKSDSGCGLRKTRRSKRCGPPPGEATARRLLQSRKRSCSAVACGRSGDRRDAGLRRGDTAARRLRRSRKNLLAADSEKNERVPCRALPRRFCRSCKPGSVPEPKPGPLSFIYGGSHLPSLATYPPASGEQPLIAGIHGLATHGTYCRATSLPPRWALTPPFHPYLPEMRSPGGRSFSVTLAIPSRISSR